MRQLIAARTLPFFGLPGNPVSSAVTFLLFAAPVLAALAGSLEPGPRFALARLAQSRTSTQRPDLTRFLPAKCTFGAAGELPEVALVPWQGSGDLAAWPTPIVFWWCPKNPISRSRAQSSESCLSEEHMMPKLQIRASRISTKLARPAWWT